MKDRIVAIIRKPGYSIGGGYWKAFSFSPNSEQADVEAFFNGIHLTTRDYFLIMRSELEQIKPSKGSSNARTLYYYTSEKYGRRFVVDTSVGFSLESRREDGEDVFRRVWRVR